MGKLVYSFTGITTLFSGAFPSSALYNYWVTAITYRVVGRGTRA